MLEQVGPAVHRVAAFQPVLHHQRAVFGHDGIEHGGAALHTRQRLGCQAVHDLLGLLVAHTRQRQARFFGAGVGLHIAPAGQIGHSVVHGLAKNALLDLVFGGLNLLCQCKYFLRCCGAACVNHLLIGVALGHHPVGLGRVAGVQVLLKLGQFNPILAQLLQHRVQLLRLEVLRLLGITPIEQLLALAHVLLIGQRAVVGLDGLLHPLGVNHAVLQVVGRVIPAVSPLVGLWQAPRGRLLGLWLLFGFLPLRGAAEADVGVGRVEGATVADGGFDLSGVKYRHNFGIKVSCMAEVGQLCGWVAPVLCVSVIRERRTTFYQQRTIVPHVFDDIECCLIFQKRVGLPHRHFCRNVYARNLKHLLYCIHVA